MQSEAQSQEPRDRGPPPPVTRAGRSAQLARAASEKRPRGRPRKDGSGGRSAPPPPPPPPPPPSKSRKKGRSRGRAQVEDEESTDAAEKKPPQKTEMKEKTSGRRRSASRRSNTNSDPCPEPDPDPDPDPDPPTVDGNSPASQAPLHSTSPREGPPVSPASDPDPAPDPDPAEPDLPSPSLSPAPMEVDSSPGSVPPEMEGGGASPAEQSPAASPCSSPLASPCLRLEDEDSLSPLFQRSLSEDSGASPTPSLGHTEQGLKQCAFCYRGDEPPLGQGRLVVFGPTPGYIPLHILNRRTSSDRDSDCHDHCYRSDQALPACSSPEQCEDESSFDFVEQLGPIGLPRDINVQSLFDPTGQCCAHLQCAAWSEGVRRGEGQCLLYVDKAIDAGSTQVCVLCKRLGASLRCRESGCGRSYHFPCAAAAGAQQDWMQRHTLCTRHAHTVSSQCESCSGGGDSSALLMCCCCGKRYHGTCLVPPLTPSSLCRVGWQCPQCRTCQSCRLRGSEGVLLVCERCDKSYHTHCLTPPLEVPPIGGWNCKNCRVCRRCGVRSSGQWANHPFLCESCDPALPCPLCGHNPEFLSPQDCVTCVCCNRCVHTECVAQAGEGRPGSEAYVCSNCRPQADALVPPTPVPHSPSPALPPSPTKTQVFSISQPPGPSLSEDPSNSPIAHTSAPSPRLVPAESPTRTTVASQENVRLDSIQIPQSAVPSPTNPAEYQQNSASSEHELTDAPQNPSPSSTNPTEHPENSAAFQSDPPEKLQSPSPPPASPREHPENSASSQSDPTEKPQSPSPSPTSPSEHPENSTSTQTDPTEASLCVAPLPPDPIEHQQVSAQSPPDPIEHQQISAQSPPDPIEHQQISAQSPPDPIEHQQNFAPSPINPTELQKNSPPPQVDPTEIPHGTAPSPSGTMELQQNSPPQSPESKELKQDSTPVHSSPTEVPQESLAPQPDRTELQQISSPSQPDPTESPQSPAPLSPEPTEVLQSSSLSQVDPTELQQSPVPSPQHSLPPQLDSTEVPQSPVSSPPSPTEVPENRAPFQTDSVPLSPASSSPNPKEVEQNSAPSEHDSAEVSQSPVPASPRQDELRQTSPLPQPDLTEVPQSPIPSPPNPRELEQNSTQLQLASTDTPQSAALSPLNHEELAENSASSQLDSTEVPENTALSPLSPKDMPLDSASSPLDSAEVPESPAPSAPNLEELPQSSASSQFDLTKVQDSAALSAPNPEELPDNSASSRFDCQELPEMAASSLKLEEMPCNSASSQLDSADASESAASSVPNPEELPHNSVSSQLESTDVSESAASLVTNLEELPQNSPSFHIDLKDDPQSAAPSAPNTKELPQISAASQFDSTEAPQSPALPIPNSNELLQSSAPSPSDLTEVPQSPASSDLNPKEVPQNSAPSPTDSTEICQSPSPSAPNPDELPQNSAPSPSDVPEVLQSSAPSPPPPADLHQNSPPSQSDSTEIPQSPAPPPHPNLSEVTQNSAPFQPDSSEVQQSPEPSIPNPTEIPQNSTLVHTDLTEPQHNASLSDLCVTELQDPLPASPLALNPEPSHLPSCLRHNADIQQDPAPSHPGSTEPYENPATVELDPSDHNQNPVPYQAGSTDLHQSPEKQDCSPSSPCGPYQLQLTSTHVTSQQSMKSPHSPPLSSPTQNSTEECLMAEESQRSPEQGSPMTCSPTQIPNSSPRHSRNMSGVSPAEQQLSSPTHSPVQDNATQEEPNRPDTPTDIIFTPSQKNSPQRQHSPAPNSPAEIRISPPQSPSQDAETLDQESPGSRSLAPTGAAQNSSTLEQQLSQAYLKSAPPECRTSLWPRSAPCSPSARSPGLARCSLSQPASPVQTHSSQPFKLSRLSVFSLQLYKQATAAQEYSQTNVTELKNLGLSPNHDGQTLENSPAPLGLTTDTSPMTPALHLQTQLSPPQSNMLGSVNSYPLAASAVPAPESLVHISTSVEHSSLTSTPRADEKEGISPSASPIHQTAPDSPCCTETVEPEASLIHIKAGPTSASPTHAIEMPASSLQASTDSMPKETALTPPATAETSSSTPQLASPVTSAECCSLEPIGPPKPHVNSAPRSCPSGSPVQPALSLDEETITVDLPSHRIVSETSPGPIPHTSDHAGHISPDHAGRSQSDSSTMNSSLSQETCSHSSCSLTAPAQIIQSGLSSPLPITTLCSPSDSTAAHSSQHSSPTHCSPPHCTLIDASPASCSVSQSLSNITSDCNSDNTVLSPVGLTEDSCIQRSPRSCPAGQASPVLKHNTSCGVDSGPIQRWTPPSASMTHSSPAHATVDHVSPPHSPGPASEPHCSPSGSPHRGAAPNSESCSVPTGVQLSPVSESSRLDMNTVDNSVLQVAVPLDTGLDKSQDSVWKTSPQSATRLPEDSSAVNQADLAHSSQSVACVLSSPDRPAAERTQSTSSISPLYQGPSSPVDSLSTHASPIPAPASPTQDDTAMPSIRIKLDSPSRPAPSEDKPLHTPPSSQASSVHSSPVSHPICSPSPSELRQTSQFPTSPERTEASMVSEPVGTSESETSTFPAPVSLSVASPEQRSQTEGEFTADVEFVKKEEQKVPVEEQKKEEEVLQQPPDNEDDQTTESPDKDSCVERTDRERERHEDREASDCFPSGPRQSPAPPTAVSDHLSQPASPFRQLTPTHASAPSTPPPSSPPLSHSPPPRAGSLEASPSSPPDRTALAPYPSSPPEDPSQDDDSQSQSLTEPVAAAAQLTKDENQSHTEPSESAEDPTDRGQPVRKEQDEEEADEARVEKKEAKEDLDDPSDAEEEEPVCPILDLDASLDVEVMELMSSSSPPPSLLNLSSLSPPTVPTRGKGRSLRPPPSYSRPSDDLAIRLRQSPFSTEASPETSPARPPVTPPPLSPPSPPLRKSTSLHRESPPLSKVPPSTVLPLTPKIGMGKPAITKRKFSPGRARVRQGSWWSNLRAVSPPSSSQDSTGEGGWDSPKPCPPDFPLWSTRVGRGSGFPGRRRSRGGGVGIGRGGRGRSRLKTQDSLTVSPGFGHVEQFQLKDEEENSMHNTVVMFSTSDHFTLKQDMCVVCGSFGQGAEGRLLACSQCGQCYHPYCVNVKITRVILTKGWRCLECTVCEACGEASDPGRLLLCDDCDISYHTYCLDPPLHTVPKGAWKCKWCVWCIQCGSASPGLHCEWQSNYSRCGPCASLSCCPLCQRAYIQDDLILQCQQCDRWVHASCQGLNTEDEVEIAADEGFDCSLCRTNSRGSYVNTGRSESLETPYMAQIITRIREPDSKTYTQDGVCLTESGLSHLQSLVEPLTSPRRYRRCKPKLKLRIINQNSVSVLQTPPEPDTPTEQDHSRGDLDCELKSDSSPERDQTHDDEVIKDSEVTDGNKKRKRKPYRPGIGGFMVRQRGGKAGPRRIKLCRKDSPEMLAGREEDVTMETAPASDQAMEKVKKRYRKKKTKLEEEFPSYLQEAFFGRDLLDRSRQSDRRAGPETSAAGQSGVGVGRGSAPSGQPVSTVVQNKKPAALPMMDDALVDLSDVLNTDPHILAMGHTGQFQVERSPSPFAGLDIGSMADDHPLTSESTGSGARGLRPVSEEPLDAILSPELDKMVSDGAILSKLYKIPELEGKDVEEVFTAVLSPNGNKTQPEHNQQAHTAAASKTHSQAPAMYQRIPLMNGVMGAFSGAPAMQGNTQAPAGFRTLVPEGPAPGPVAANQASGESESDGLSTAQRGMLKWEKEEILGEMATVAPVLYCNTNFPQLKEQYPEWSTRVKQIAKLWRKASSQDRAPFVQKARDNRAAQRINKVHLSNEPLKHQQALQPPPGPGPFDPGAIEPEMTFKDPLRPKESEQEQEWKLRQQMRQKSKQLAKMEATQKLEQVKNEQLMQQRQQQQLLAGQGSHAPVAGGNASPLQPAASRDLQARQQSSGLADDVFLRPQAPPPSGFSSLPHSPHPSSPLHQPPSSPQMFSPSSSRPSSPWDPYSKAVGTPRPGGPQGSQQQRCNSLSASPAHDPLGSPAPSPDPKPSEGPRVLVPQPGLQQSRTGMMSPPSAGPDHQARCVPVRAEAYTRAQGGVFKAPMPPQQEPFSGPGGARRDMPRPADLGFALPTSQDTAFPSSPMSGLGSPHRSPYAQAPGTPRLDYGQQVADPFAQQTPLTSRPSPDQYANPQTPGTPRPHSDPAYHSTPTSLRVDQFNQPANRRLSPSQLPFDPYASNPATPHPAIHERFPRSPGSQRSSDPYAQPPGTPRPSPDPYNQQPSTPRPGESFAPQPAQSPLGPGLSTDIVPFTPTHLQSPGRQQPDSFPRNPGGQTPKHPGMSEETGFLVSQTPGHTTPSQTDKTPASDVTAVGVASLDGPMSMLPQLGDSEEKLRQRQRLRQLILRQQQQKSALRQEKGLQEPAAGSAPGPVATPPADMFGRPPPPYPGTVRPAGAPVGPAAGPVLAPRFPGAFAGEQQRAAPPSDASFPRQTVPRELAVRGPGLRFGVPPGVSAGLQDCILRPPQGAVPVPGPGAVDAVSFQIRRQIPAEFAGRLLTAPNAAPHVMPAPPAVPQPFLPRSLPPQPHSIMGQPYIELRHRAPENRLRLPHPLAVPQEPEVSLVVQPPQPLGSRPGTGGRMGEVHFGPSMALPGGVEPLQQHLGGEPTLPGADGMEEHMEAEDSAVKDLEDVEVKDLVDLNLNLDPEDGKEDLDLGPNDLHLDDFLLSGKFDLIAYTDPELNLEDKKDMFNEELDLGEEDKEAGARRDAGRKMDPLIGQIKQEEDSIKRDIRESSFAIHASSVQPELASSRMVPGTPGVEGAGSSLLAKEKSVDSGSALQAQEQTASSNMAARLHPTMAAGPQPGFQQRAVGPAPSALLNPPPSAHPQPTHPGLTLQTPLVQPHLLALQTPQPHLLQNAQNQPPLSNTPNQVQGPIQGQVQSQVANPAQNPGQNKSKLLLLEEQPLLLQDLLDQERQEQQQQKQMQALIRHKTTPEPAYPDMADFGSITDPIMKAKMVALKGINKVMTQGNLGLNRMVINRFQPPAGAPPAETPPQSSHMLAQEGKLNPQLVRPTPPNFGPGFVNEAQRRQYEEWLGETKQLLQMQQGLLEDQIAAHRKSKKALSAKQRTAKKAGRALTEEDAAQLRYITEQQGTVQKQLEQIRKQQKDHTELIEDYRNKQRVMQPAAAPAPPHTLGPHQGGPAPVRVANVPAGWTPGGGSQGPMTQRMPPHLPPQMAPTLPTPPQAPAHSQNPPAMVARLTAGLRGPPPGPIVAAGEGAAPAPQVKFDDNNPFSEGFQERERRERLREQQERQRVQLLQEVERHRVLQQRMEMEQQSLLGTPVATTPVGPTPVGDSLSQMPFFSSELPLDFLQSPPSRPSQPATGMPFPAQGFPGGPLHPAERGRNAPEPGPHLEARPSGPAGPSTQGQALPPGTGGSGMTPSHPGSQGHRFGHSSSSSSPSASLPHSFPGSSSTGPSSLVQLYSDILPDDKPKKKRSRKREGDDTACGARTPLSSHSDDITAPPTPALSDTSCSTPTRGSVDLSDFLPQGSGLVLSSELERQLSEGASGLGGEAPRGGLLGAHLEVKKEEREERGACGGGAVKMEEFGGASFSSPLHGGGKDGDGGKELLKHLLKDKSSPANTPSPTGQAPPAARRQLSTESVRSEEDDGGSSHGNVMMMMTDSPGQDILDPSGKKKPQRCKRVARPDKDKAPPKYKRRKREEDEKMLHSPPDPVITNLRQLSVLPLMEPVLGVDLSLFPPFGSSSLGRDSRLSGSFGNACLDGVTDYYSQLIYKQNNLSNPPTPPASLPPTPPPVARQKLLNGFATTEELSRKELSEQDVKGMSAVKQKGEELLVINHTSKTVDVPASLPTPPHNNQEELRVQDSSGRSSPDGFVPSSSPESVVDMEVSRYPDLSFIKLEPPSPCPSPPVPIMPCASGKGTAVKQEVKSEPNHQAPSSCSNTDLVTISITLNPVAAQNVPGVMATVADLLRVPVPLDYQLSRVGGPERSSLALLAGVRVPLPQASAARQQRPSTAGNTGLRMDYIQHGGSAAARPPTCSQCKVLLGNGVRIIKQEGPSSSSVIFCSPRCSALYTSALQNRNKAACERSPPSRATHQYTNNMSSITVHSLPRAPIAPPATAASSPPLHFPSASTVTMEVQPRMDSLKVKVKLKPHPRAVSGEDDLLISRHGKRIKSCRWRRWSVSITVTRGPCLPHEAVAMPTEEEVDVLLKKLGACLRPDPLPKDQRRCCFCHQQGDGETDGPARLLNLDLDLWVHLNCALWSSEVYETQAGALINVELALRRGLTLRCAHCQQTGATSGCNRLRCTNTYHFTCALQAHCTFFKDKTMLCHIHKPRITSLSGDRSSSSSPSSTPGLTPDLTLTCDPYDSELRCFAVFRRVYVQRDEARQIAAVVQRGERQHTFRVGSLLFRAVGRLLPHQMYSFHNQSAIFPVGYHTNRIYWSMRHSNRRCKYMCYIEEEEGKPLFKVKVVEKGYDDLILTAATPKGVWGQILDPVSRLRSSTGMLKLFPVYLKGEDLFGLTTSAVSRIIESLPGVEACERYTFRYGRNPLMEWPLAFNPSGSARSEPKAYQAKRPYLLTSIAPRCQGSVGSIVGLVPGVISLSPGESVAGAHQGRHSKSSQYRRMKAEWKSNVYLARSRIQGLGLYAARDIEKCTMVIEYIGTIIRSEVANRKERLYESQNRGVYMFRIDNDFVIDATITGGPARYINHSCAPNCITEVVTVEKENKIIISSCRRIQRGEELCYDYKFDLEDDQHKIPCHCGAFNCRKWMN